MDTNASATPEGAPESEETAFDAMLAKMAAEDEAEGNPEAKQAETPDDGDAEKAPKADDEAETADEAEKPPEGDKPATPTTVKVKVNGEELEVPLDEALKGYSRTEDYKAKTAALATEKRQYSENLQSIVDRFIALDPVLAEAKSTDWATLARTDPAEYVARQHAVNERQQMLAAVQAESDRVKAETQRDVFAREYEALAKAMPQVADPEGAAKFDSEIRAYLKAAYKYTDAEINAVTDHRNYLLIDKARKYDALQSARKSLPAKKTAPEPTVKTVKPGSAEAPRTSSPRKPPANAKMSEVQAWLARNV